MAAFKANPLAYIFPAVVLAGIAGYYLYGVLDRTGLETRPVAARVTGKQFTPGARTYNTNVAGGHAWTQSNRYPDAYVVSLDIDGTATAAFVEKELFEALETGDAVRAEICRTRFSHQLQVRKVTR